jgi:hypothetical protein
MAWPAADLLGGDMSELARYFAEIDTVVHLSYYRPPGTTVTGAGKTCFVDAGDIQDGMVFLLDRLPRGCAC